MDISNFLHVKIETYIEEVLSPPLTPGSSVSVISEPCLICSSVFTSVELDTLKVLPTVPPGLDKDAIVNDNLWPIFLLRKILQLPKEECENLLSKTYGLNPSSWFRVCDLCCETVNDAFLIYDKILELEKNMVELRKELEVKMNMSLQSEKINQELEEELIFSPRKYVREYLAESQITPNGYFCASTGSHIPISNRIKDEQLLENGNTVLPGIKIEQGGHFRTSDPVRINGSSYECTTCHAKFNYKGYLQRHMKIAHSYALPFAKPRTNTVKSYNCIGCHLKFKRLRDLQSHKKKVHPNLLQDHQSQLKSDQLPVPTSDSPNMVIKARRQNQKMAKAKVVNENGGEEVQPPIGFSSLINVDKTSPFMCIKCGVRYTTERILKLHFGKYHSTSNTSGNVQHKIHRCQHCPAQVSTRRALQLHLRTSHANLFKYQCNLCKACYSHRSHLFTHKKLKHPQPQPTVE